MPRKAAVVLTASALSVTIGVLIGIVLIIGNRARQPSDAVASTSAATTAFGGTLSLGGEAPISDGAAQISVLAVDSSPATTTSATPSRASTISSSKVTSQAVAPSRPAAARPSRPPRTRSSTPTKPTATRPAIVYTTVTIAPPTSSSLAPSTPSSSPTLTTTATPAPTTTPTPTPTAAAAPGGPAAPGRPCAALGDQSTATGGFTVFCQHDFSNGSLAWRAVVNGGGCLSKKMTGIGTDGQHYRCRPDRGGLDHWRRG